MEPNWKIIARNYGENPTGDQYDEVRREQCVAREYLIRSPTIEIPGFDTLLRIADPREHSLQQQFNKHYLNRRPKVELPPVTAVGPWLKSFVIDTEYLCWKCRKINFDDVFHGTNDFEPFTLIYQEMKNPTRPQYCQLCDLLMEVVAVLSLDPLPWAEYGPGHWTVDVTKDELVLYFGATRRGQLRMKNSQAGLKEDDSSDVPHAWERSSENREKLDISFVRKWIQNCEKSHIDTCSSPWPGPKYQEAIDLILIDVEKKCLVRGKSSHRYLTLSYVWGNVTTLQTKKANFEALQMENGLLEASDPIGRVLLDTMQLVKDVGERYLWADTLCIVQDDQENKSDAIMNMDIVYGHSLLTVIAASGYHANIGLPGVTNEPRPLLSINRTINGIPIVFRGAELSDMLRHSPYEIRAWTMQERMLSRRCLYLSQHQAYFQCVSDYRCEDYHDSKFWEKNSDRGQTLPFSPNPLSIMQQYPVQDPRGDLLVWSRAIYTYRSLVKMYSERKLTHNSDSLNAFEGVLGILREVCKGPFTWALPEDIFDMALLWTPQRPTGMESRVEGNFPSWSWVSWAGSAHYLEHSPVHIPGEPVENEPYPDNEGKFRDMRYITEKHLSPADQLACRDIEFKLHAEISDIGIKEHGKLRIINRAGAGTLYWASSRESKETLIRSVEEAYESSSIETRSPPPMLCFFADMMLPIHFDLADPQRHVQYAGKINLYFGGGKKCGCLFGDSNTFGGLGLREGGLRVLILLSRMPGCGTDSSIQFDESFGEEGWYVCNVMLIEWKLQLGWAERIATGVMHSTVWDRCHKERSLILLG